MSRCGSVISAAIQSYRYSRVTTRAEPRAAATCYSGRRSRRLQRVVGRLRIWPGNDYPSMHVPAMVAFYLRVIWTRLAFTVIAPVSVLDLCTKVKLPLRLFPVIVVSHAVMSLLITPNSINGSNVALPVR
jgi:hypothetical protein